MKRFLRFAIVFSLTVLVSDFTHAKLTEDPGHYLQKILLVVDSPDSNVRLRYENALRTQSHLYTPRVDTLVSSPILLNLKTLSKAKDLESLATEHKFDGILVIENLTTTTRDAEACPNSRSGDIVTHIVDTLTTKCPIIQIPRVECSARLYGVSPHHEIWHLDVSWEGTPKDPKTPEKLFDSIAIKIFKAIQRDKFILPSRYQR